MNPLPLRVLSIATHAGCSILVFILSMKITNNDRLMSLMSSLLFASHPVHVEAVISVINLSEPACCLLYLSAIILYIHFSKETRFPMQIISAVLILIIILVSTLLKENGITSIGVVLALVSLKVLNSSSNMPSNTDILYISTSILAFFVYVLVRKLISSIDVVDFITNENGPTLYDLWQLLTESSFYLDNSELIRKAENPFCFLTGKEKILSYVYLHWRYLFLLLVPWNLCAEYAFNCIPPVTKFWDPRMIFPVVMYFGLFFTSCVHIYRISKRQFKECVPIFLILIIVPFLPMSGILKLGTLLAERLLYIPSVGFCMILSYTFKHLCAASGGRRFYVIVSCLVVCCYSYRVITRNPAWKDDKTLYLESLKVCPSSAKLNLQLSKMYFNEGNIPLSKKHLHTAKNIDKDFCDIGYEEALISLAEGNVEQSERLALENLSCLYSSMYSFKILNDIWSQRLNMYGHQNVQVQVDIAGKCQKYGLSLIAVQRFLVASQESMNQKKYSYALELCEKAEDAYLKMLQNDTAHDKEFDALICNLHAYSGKLRYLVRGEKGMEDYGMDSIVPYLLKSIDRSCSRLIITDSGLISPTNSLSSIYILSKLYEEAYHSTILPVDELSLLNTSKITFLKEYSSILDTSMLSLLICADVLYDKLLVSNNANIESFKDFGDIINLFDTLNENFKIISIALAQHQFRIRKYNESREVYESVIARQNDFHVLLKQEVKIKKYFKVSINNDKEVQKRHSTELSCKFYHEYGHSILGTNYLHNRTDENRLLMVVDLLYFSTETCQRNKKSEEFFKQEQRNTDIVNIKTVEEISEFLQNY